MLKTILVLVLLLVGLGVAAEGKRVALVIGNTDYGALGQLKNPANDARDMGVALGKLGFQIEVLVNADLPAMENAVIKLSSLLSSDKSSTGFFFYAGHGVQSSGVNYLLPSKVEIPAEAFLKTKALSAQSVMDLLQGAGNGLNIVVLDACRDNPFAWSRSLNRGLSVVGSQPPGSIVAYATSAGSTAQDGTGRNGVFTGELLKHLAKPGVDIKKVFDLTGSSVMSVTNNKQVPAVYSQYFGDYFLASAPPSALRGTVDPTPAETAPLQEREAPDSAAGKTSVWSWLQYSRAGKGLRFFANGPEDTGESRTVEGREAWVITGNPLNETYPALLYFNLDDPRFQNGAAGTVEVTVEYFDDRGGQKNNPSVRLEYSSAGRHLKPGQSAAFEPAGSDLVVGTAKTWKSFTWKLDDALFNRQTNGRDFRLGVFPGFELAISAVTVSIAGAPVAQPTADPLNQLGGVWYFQGTGAGDGKGPGNHQDTRLQFDTSARTYVFYHYESPSTFKSWRKDVAGDTQSIDDIDDEALLSTLTQKVDVPWGGAEVGAKTRMLYRFVGDELQLWWDWGQGLPDPYSWKDYVSYKRTRP
jgi:hypothetical protein